MTKTLPLPPRAVTAISPAPATALHALDSEIVACRKCPRLVAYREKVAREKRRAFREWEYWGKPVPGFGDPRAKLFLLGLAPGAHGSNRTGRMFTGDRSGDFLYEALERAGFANQALSSHRQDGLTLKNAYMAATLRCAPPANKPLPSELSNCRPYLERELRLLKNLRVVVALGRIAFDTYLSLINQHAKFGHNLVHAFSPILIASYHPSQQNTSTGKLTAKMLREVFERARSLSGVE